MKEDTYSQTLTHTQDNRREFLRLDFRSSIRFKTIQKNRINAALGTVDNVSESGLLFTSNIVPEIASILWLSLDLKTLGICQKIESNVLMDQGGILGRVVRLEENRGAGNYRVGVCFLTNDINPEIVDR
ncbi:MAG: hypothetical protein ACI9CF_000326 [Candidatus Omnitrophota bacterium]|jgi:hypothetical protein